MDVVAAEETSLVIEDDLIEVVVVVEEWQPQRLGVALERTRHEGADDEPTGHEGRMGRRRQMGAMAHQRPQVAPVDAHHAEIAMPADGIQRIEREGDGRQCVAPLHRHRPGALVLLRLEDLVDMRRVEHRRIEDRVPADQPLLGQREMIVRRLDHERGRRCGWRQAPHRAARDHDVVAVTIFETAIVAEQVPRSFVHEQELVAVAVAGELGHRVVELPDPHLQVRVAHHQLRLPWVGSRLGELVHVECARPDRSLEGDPVGRLVLVMELRRGSEEALLADLALEGAFGQAHMSLARRRAFDLAQRNPVFGHGSLHF